MSVLAGVVATTLPDGGSSMWVTLSGTLGALAGAAAGRLLRLPHDRAGRLTMDGSLLGGLVGIAAWLLT